MGLDYAHVLDTGNHGNNGNQGHTTVTEDKFHSADAIVKEIKRGYHSDSDNNNGYVVEDEFEDEDEDDDVTDDVSDDSEDDWMDKMQSDFTSMGMSSKGGRRKTIKRPRMNRKNRKTNMEGYSYEYRIKQRVIMGYDKTTRPVRNDSTTTTVYLGMSLFHILNTVGGDTLSLYNSCQ